MFNLHSFLEKFKDLKDPKEEKTLLSNIIFDRAGVKVKEGEITVQKGTVFIQASSLYKTRIFLTKQEILSRIAEELPHLNIREII